MSFRGDEIEDESLLWSPEYISESPEPCLPLRQPQNHQHQARHQQQQPLGISHESLLRGNLLNVRPRVQQCFFSQPMLSSFQDPSLLTMNQTGMGQRIGLGNGVARPTMSYSNEFPNHLREIQHVSSDAFGSVFPQHSHRLSDDNLPVNTTNITATSLNRVELPQEQHCLCAHTLSTREPLLNSQYHNYYDLNQTMAVNTEHSSLICPSNLIPNGPQNYMPYQTYVPVTSDFTIDGHQLHPSVLAMRRNEVHSLGEVNNSSRHHVLMQSRVHQSSSSVSSLYTQMRTCPSANSGIPPLNEVLGSRRRTYENRSQFGEPSSSTRRRMTIQADESVGSAPINPAEESRVYNGPYDEEYERQGLYLDPHMRKFTKFLNRRHSHQP